MAHNPRAAALVASTIALAHSLGLRMVAEGVETGVVFAELRRMGCDQAQGYFMSRPVCAVEFDHWLSHRPELDRSTDITSRQRAWDRDLDRGPTMLTSGACSLYPDPGQ
jgi:predicted signal transduction protein with EAL and GGDEF domain